MTILRLLTYGPVVRWERLFEDLEGQLAAEWERLPTTTVGDESSGSGGSSDDAKTDRKKDARENTRRVRREQRHKTKGNATARDAKFGGAP